MPSPLKIHLKPSEEQDLLELITNPKIPQRTRERAESLRLSALMVESIGDRQSS